MTRVAGLMVLLLVATVKPAAADFTGFLGVSTAPDARRVTGVALGAGLLVVGFEFEYASTSEDLAQVAPSLKMGMGNLLLQTPVSILRMQPYFTIGGGIYQERLDDVHQQTGVGINTGGGVKVTLVGPLRLRLDYRVFNLGDDALYSPSHRLYAGLNLKF